MVGTLVLIKYTLNEWMDEQIITQCILYHYLLTLFVQTILPLHMLFPLQEYPHCLALSHQLPHFLTRSACPGGWCPCITWHRQYPSIPVRLGLSRASRVLLWAPWPDAQLGSSYCCWPEPSGPERHLKVQSMDPLPSFRKQEPLLPTQSPPVNSHLRDRGDDQEDEANGTLMKFREKTKLGGVANTMEEEHVI